MAKDTWYKNGNGHWTYETHVDGDFKLHLEKEFGGSIIISVKGAGTKYAPGPAFNDTGSAFEKNFYGGGACDIMIVCYCNTEKANPTINIVDL